MLLADLDTYEAIYREFRWQVPERFNIARAVCDDWAMREPDRPALVRYRTGGTTDRWTYGQLKDRSDRLATVLRQHQVAPGDRVAIILAQDFEVAAAHVAIYKCGGIAVPLARLFGEDALKYRLGKAAVCVVITDQAGASKIAAIRQHLPDLALVLSVDGAGAGAQDYHRMCADVVPQPHIHDTFADSPALIIFTSGTTGPPKGALHGHRVLIGHMPGIQIHHEFFPQPGDVAWTPADWAWAGGLLNILLPSLYMGVPVVFSAEERFDPQSALALICDTKVRNGFIPPTALRLMRSVFSETKPLGTDFRTIGSGGESLGADTFEWARAVFEAPVNEFYGQTECNLVLSAFSARGVAKAGAIGKPVPGHQVAVLDDGGNIAKVGAVGQVAVKWPDPVMFLGYWQDEEATKNKFIGDWMTTGDQCVLGADGYFRFVGRDDDIITSAGYRVGPSEIEDCLVSHPAVKLAAVVGKPDPVRTELIKAYVVLADGVSESQDLLTEIRQHARSRVSANLYPREIEVVEAIPLTTTGKVIRRHFRERARKETLD